MFKPTPLASAIALLCACLAVHAEDASSNSADSAAAGSGTGSAQRVEISGARQQLDAARNSLSPDTGSTTFRFDDKDIAALPLGDATPLNQLVLRTPGVVQDAGGELHVRGDHGNLQYRVNGVVIPESIGGFGQALDTRFASQVNVFTGALPAQYGYRTAGVVDIRTKGDAADNSGTLDLGVGTQGHREASLQAGGSAGNWSGFGVVSGLVSNAGIENPTPERQALHDRTQQAKAFGLASYLIDDNQRVSVMLGSANNRFQIPNLPGQAPAYQWQGVTAPASDQLDARQRERNDFQVLSYQGGDGSALDYQVALFHRRSEVQYAPDAVGDLLYNGVASQVTHRNDANGLQADGSWHVNPQHTVRSGVFLQHERATVDNTAQVFSADAEGHQTATQPITVIDQGGLAGWLGGVYLQDEWQPTKALTVNYGVRYDRVTTVTREQQWSPRVGVVYQLDADTRVHGGYARYFTPPPTEKIDTTSVQKFAGTTNALPSDANTGVQAERSHYVDLGIAHELSREVTLSADAYYRDIRHLQDEGQFGKALIESAFNFERGRIYGLELAASYKTHDLSAYVNLALSKARGTGLESGQFNFDPDELAYINSHWVSLDHDQRVAASTGVTWTLPGSMQLGVDAVFGSGLRRGFANTEHLPAYTVVDASVSRSVQLPSAGKLDVRLAATNLFDRVYQLRDGSGIGVGAPQFGARRGIVLMLSKPFGF